MRKWIRVTSVTKILDQSENGELVVNMDHVQLIVPLSDGGTRLIFASEPYINVKETEDQISRMVGS